MIKLNDVEIIATRFPDKTQQVYQINPTLFKPLSVITWNYENDSELMTLAQLVDNMRSNGVRAIQLDMPYLPYGRQDKPIRNDMTFGLHTFAKLLNSLDLDVITTYDAHSKMATELIKNLKNIPPSHIYNEIKNNAYDLIAFPDHGALYRYSNNYKPRVYGEKFRDPDNGNIIGYELIDDGVNGDMTLLQTKSNINVLVVDDLVDGGATFIKLAELIKKQNNTAVLHLCISHVIQPKAIDKLKEIGYNTIKDKNGYL